MFRLEIGTGDAKGMSRVIGLMMEVIGSLEHEWRNVVHPYLLRHWEKQFATEGEHGGRPWEGYGGEPKYADHKMAIVGHHDLLRWDKGGKYERLYPSITEPSHTEHVFRADATSMTAGTAVPYSDRLISGGTGPFGETYPGRDWQRMTTRQKKKLVTLIQRSIRRRLSDDALRNARIT